MNDELAMAEVIKIEHEHRIREAARWRRATEIERAQRGQRSNRLFGRKKADTAISTEE